MNKIFALLVSAQRFILKAFKFIADHPFSGLFAQWLMHDLVLVLTIGRCTTAKEELVIQLLLFCFFSLRCPNDATLKYLSAPSFSAQRFSLEAFKFIADHPFVFVHCHVIVCNATDTKCVKGCSPGGRGRREASTHVTHVYSLAQGPIQMVLEKREGKQSGGLDMRGMYTYKGPVTLTICMQNK